MRSEEFDALLALGEPGGVEFKSTQALTSPRPWKIIRSILGLSNRRDGGYVIVGIREDADKQLVLDGMDAADLDTWSEDAAIDLMSEYSEPRSQIRVQVHPSDLGKSFIVVRVQEFEEQPVLCKRDGGQGVLRRGALYVRPRGRGQTVENGSMEDMRSLLKLATDKRLGELLRTMNRAGIVLGSGSTPAAANDSARYDEELRGYLGDN